MFVRVAINIPTEQIFTYGVPQNLQKDIAVGKRVLVPFGGRKATGYILNAAVESDYEEVKDVIRLTDDEPLYSTDDLKFYQWLSDYYLHPLGQTLAYVLPSGIEKKHELWFHRLPVANESALSDAQRRTLAVIDSAPRGISSSELKKRLDKKAIKTDIDALAAAGLVSAEERSTASAVRPKTEKVFSAACGNSDIKATPKEKQVLDFLSIQGPTTMNLLQQKFSSIRPNIRALIDKGLILVNEREINRHHGQSFSFGRAYRKVTLNSDQKRAVNAITESLMTKRFSPVLLHGVTGSGKTEVYFRAIDKALAMGGSVIYLVPEIALTPQLISRFQDSFGDLPIAVIHSAVARGSRYDQWRQIQRGDIRVVIGARSALFTPMRGINLIICDEEHDHAYKQEDRLRYNARDLAVVRAQIADATVILGSATPGIQTFHNCKNGKYRYLSLPHRVEDRPMPEVEIVDMRLYHKEKGTGGPPVLSAHLLYAIEQTLKMKKQTLLFLNRRGYHTFMICPACGYVFKCRNCAVSLTHHAESNELKCHYCDYKAAAAMTCPECHGKNLCAYGTGTERLEEEVKRFFPEAQVARMDSDSTAKKGAYAKILKDLESGAIDVLVGTQMITKGHDFPNITLVGVVSADTMLNMPDFRAAERTFQALMQVAGRGGRSEVPAKVIIQTFNPDHYAVKFAKLNDYEGFYKKEIMMRKSLDYPPMSRLVNIHISSNNRDIGMESLDRISRTARTWLETQNLSGKIELLGPAEAPIARVKGRYRWQFLLKGKNMRELNRLTRYLLKNSRRSGLMIKCDIDPVSFM